MPDDAARLTAWLAAWVPPAPPFRLDRASAVIDAALFVRVRKLRERYGEKYA